MSSLICWKCKERGHRRSECPQLKSGKKEGDATNPSGSWNSEGMSAHGCRMDSQIPPIVVFKTGSINGALCEITVDTGSNISIVRPDLLGGVNEDLFQPVHSYIRTVTGEQAPIRGKGRLELGIGPLVIPQELWVADIQDQCILGLDFLYPNGCQVNLRDHVLSIGEHQIPLRRSPVSTSHVCCKAVLVQDACPPPTSPTVKSVTVDLLEQTVAAAGLLVERTLVTKDSIPLMALNLSQQPVTQSRWPEQPP